MLKQKDYKSITLTTINYLIINIKYAKQAKIVL